MDDARSTMKSDNLLPDHFGAYFWDTRFTGRELLDWPEHAIERVLEYGQWRDIRFLRGIVGDPFSLCFARKRLNGQKGLVTWTVTLQECPVLK
jgi:hypothetical protein